MQNNKCRGIFPLKQSLLFPLRYLALAILTTVTLSGCGGGGGSSRGNSGEEPIENFTLTVEKFGEGVVASNVSGVSCGNDCSESYPSGTTVVLTATADSGSQINSWVGCDSTSGSTCTVTMDSGKMIFPTFALSTMSYKAGAVILDDTTMQKLVNLDGTTYYFDSTATELSTLQAGNVIASSGGDGLLRRVVSVSITFDGQYAVETADAALEDVIEQGTITFSQVLTHSDLKAVAKTYKGVRLRKAAVVDDEYFIFDIKDPVTGEALVIYDADDSLTTESDQIRAIGSVTANFTVDVAANIKEKEFKTVLITKIAQDLKVIVGENVVLSINKEVPLELLDLNFGPFPVIGVISLNVDIAPYVGVEVDANAALTTRVTMNASSTAGVHYMKGEGWKTIMDPGSKCDPTSDSTSTCTVFGFDPVNVTAKTSVKGYVGSEFALLLSDTLGAVKGGPFISGEGYLRMNAGANPLWWKLYGGIGASAGVKIKFLWRSVPDLPSVELYNKEWRIASSDTSTITDTTPPTDPTGLVAADIFSNKVDLLWNASSDDTGVVGYYVYRNGLKIDSVSSTSAIDAALNPSTNYCYTVSAYDISDNESGQSVQVCVSTLSTSDTTAPSAPTNLVATAVSSSQINLSWSAPSDNDVAGYVIYWDGASLASVTPTSTSNTGLSASTQYCYTVSAFDGAGNVSNQSVQACATTPLGTAWEEFESYSAGSFPSTWTPDANANDNTTNYVDSSVSYLGSNSLRLHGSIGSCWAALAYRPLTVSPPYEVELAIRNGTESLSGCHPARGDIGLRKGTSWTNSSRNFLTVDEDGALITASGTYNFGSIDLLTWHKIKIRYERPSSSETKITYWIDGVLKGTETLASLAEEDQMTNLELVVQEGTVWFDEISVRQIQTIPNAPINLVGTLTSSYTANVQWEDNSINEEGFRFEAYTFANNTGWVWNGVNTTESFMNINLAVAHESFPVRVRSYNNAGYSEWVNATVTLP